MTAQRIKLILCKKYTEIDHRIKLHRQDKNIGVAENFNFV